MTIITQTNSQYGAQMGRCNGQIETNAVCYAMPVPLCDGYDMGGAYWGHGQTLWAVIDQDGDSTYHRASSQDDAFEAADVDTEYRQSALPADYAREYLAALIYGNAVDYREDDEEDDWDDSYETQHAQTLADSVIADDTLTSLTQIRSIADCY